MKLEFNPDGSLKLSQEAMDLDQKNSELFAAGKAIKLKREIISSTTPLKCLLTVEVPDNFKDKNRIPILFNGAEMLFESGSELTFTRISPNIFTVDIVSGMRRCSWCKNFERFMATQLNIKVITKNC